MQSFETLQLNFNKISANAIVSYQTKALNFAVIALLTIKPVKMLIVSYIARFIGEDPS